MNINQLVTDLKGKLIINKYNKKIEANTFDKKEEIFFDFKKGKRKEEDVVSLEEIITGDAVIQETLF